MADEKTDEVVSEEEAEEPKATWEFKKEFEINRRMKEVIGLTIKATESELKVLRRKLDKMTYGS